VPDFEATVFGVYPIGQGNGVAVPNGNSFSSNVLNTRDLGQPGAPDFLALGPGSQIWYVGYSIRVSSALAPTDTLGLLLTVGGAYELTAPFLFGQDLQLTLPVYQPLASYTYSGRVRIEAPAAAVTVFNNTGQELTVSFQFWGKAL
jgi:hypothetical protein